MELPGRHPPLIQALEEGCEFLLVFDDGNFEENETFLITDWFAHTPRAVLAKNFGVPEAAFANIPADIEHERYIFPAPVPGPIALRRSQVARPAPCPIRYNHRLLAQAPIKACGRAGAHRRLVQLPGRRPRSRRALVEVEPGALRELHWHPNNDEWQYYISGRARMTVFAHRGRRAPSTTRPATSATCRSRWATTSRTPATSRCASWRCSAATASPTCRSISGWR